METFKAWRQGQDETKAREMSAENAEHAAEIWADLEDFESCEFEIVGGETVVVVVRELGSQDLLEFEVSGSNERIYSATPMQD